MQPEIPIEQLAAEVYDAAPAAEKERMVSQLVGKIYETAPAAVRSNLILTLMKPLGVLSLVAVADGIFAKIRFRGGWPDVQVLPDDVKNVEPQDVVALTHYAQQVSLHVLDGLARVVTSSPVLATSAAAALLIHILMQRHGVERRAKIRD
ncbi:hypothetical protein [Rhodoferax saidenbachensis]|uniref:Uncharacterized protein n=1 Tax=Rhodoferax saidenbachensis TaxID=1484693 RepID=A0ABU1ZQ91_9BURK|nr:hypothetical protein [Rhodoferax saidenbachensis]MDR7307727.1 hypothetical protein [Rhodoferax saidenbachensis]